MSELSFREMAMGDAADLATVVDFFGDEAHAFFEQGFRYIIGFRDGIAVVGATCDSGYSEFDVESSEESVRVYESMIAEIERLAMDAGASGLCTIAEATTDRPKFIAALVNRGFDGPDCMQLSKSFDESDRLQLANQELASVE